MLERSMYAYHQGRKSRKNYVPGLGRRTGHEIGEKEGLGVEMAAGWGQLRGL